MALLKNGQQLDNYRIEALLGEGGMGAVYRARDIHLDRQVAIKVMHSHLAAQPKFQQRFMQEARAVARLDHPAIINIYHFGQHDDMLYMVMAYIPGASLGRFLHHLEETQQVVRLQETLLVLAQVATALDYAHRQGVVHRDVKPDNILLQRWLEAPPKQVPLRAVVTDFGLAKLLEGGVHTGTGAFMGTLPYMSPEQCLSQELDGRSDIYSLGVVLYQLATGQLPFEIRSPTDAVLKHLNETPPAPAEVRPGVPHSVADIIEKALQKDPDERFQHAREMGDALRSAADRLTDQDVTRFTIHGAAASLITDWQVAMETAGPSRGGSELPLPDDGDQLLIGHPDAAPRALLLDRPELTIGRTMDNDVVLPDSAVSRRHARLSCSTDGWLITDLHSTNGTRIDEKLLEPHIAIRWPAGQVLRIGPYALRWRRATLGAEPPPPPVSQADTVPLEVDTDGSSQATTVPERAAAREPIGKQATAPALYAAGGVALVMLCLLLVAVLIMSPPGRRFRQVVARQLGAAPTRAVSVITVGIPPETPTATGTATNRPPTVTTQPATSTPTAAPPTLTPTPENMPRVNSLYFCADPCRADGSNATTSFPPGTTQIYVRWEFENFPVGAAYTRHWTNQGQEWVRYQCSWPGPVSGTDAVPLTEPDGLRSGEWQVTIMVDTQVVAQEAFTVEGNWTFWTPAGVFNSCYGRR